jgi:hypothetical protein
MRMRHEARASNRAAESRSLVALPICPRTGRHAHQPDLAHQRARTHPGVAGARSSVSESGPTTAVRVGSISTAASEVQRPFASPQRAADDRRLCRYSGNDVGEAARGPFPDVHSLPAAKLRPRCQRMRAHDPERLFGAMASDQPLPNVQPSLVHSRRSRWSESAQSMKLPVTQSGWQPACGVSLRES